MFFDVPSGQESRPLFSDIPLHILERISAQVKEPVIAGETAHGGFSAGAAFSLKLQDGRKIFTKGAHPGDLSHATQNIRQEIQVYERALASATIAPAFLGSVSDGDEDGWHLGLWEHIDTTSTSFDTDQTMAALVSAHRLSAAALHSYTDQNYIQFFFAPDRKWQRVIQEKNAHVRAQSLFHSPEDGACWLDRAAPDFYARQKTVTDSRFLSGLMHGDLHRDNILHGRDRTYIVDWPNACRGPVYFDVLFLAAVLESTDGTPIEKTIQAYVNAGGDAETDDNIATLAVCMAGFWIDQAGRAVPEKLPRLRWVQKSMLLALLKYLARRGMCESIPRMANQRV